MTRRRVLLKAVVAALLAMLATLPLWTMPHGAVQAAVAEVEFTRLAGPTRYSTAVRIAEAYMDLVDDQPGQSRVDTVILGSGLDEHFGYVTPVPLLSRLNTAPLVFTRPDELPVPVAEMLQRRNISRAILLGGTGVISTDVERALRDVGVDDIERVGSDDIHEHAVAVAESLDHPPGDFPKKGSTALLATSNVFADALAAGPMAYQGEYPILLTTPDRLHPAVFDYLLDSDIEHLIILGGTAAVGAAVQTALAGLDFTIARIAGADRYQTATRLAETQLADDGLRPCFDGSQLGLAYGRLSPDAIASGPLLGELCAPLLLTETDTLPRAVSSFLRSDDFVTGDADNELAVTVFGGTSVVSTELVAQFFEKVTTLVPVRGAIRAELNPDTGTTREFTADFDITLDPKKAVDLSLYRVNLQRITPGPSGCNFAGDDIDADLLYGCVTVRLGKVIVQLSEDLEDGDLITVVGGHRIGKNNSARPLARFSYIVREDPEIVDREAPEVEIVAPAGQNTIAVLVIEAKPLNPPALTHDLASRIEIVDADGNAKALADAVSQPGRRERTRAGHDRYVFSLDPGTAKLAPGDVITVPRGTFRDEDNRLSKLARFTVRPHSTDFRIDSITIGDVGETSASVTLDGATQIDATTADPEAPPIDLGSSSLKITARTDGAASGARGNNWRIYGTVRRIPQTDDTDDTDDEETDPVISVVVQTASRVIRYRITDGEPTFADLADALVANSGFAANFFVEELTVDEAHDETSIEGTSTTGEPFSGGGTAVGVRVRFSDPVQGLVLPQEGKPGDCIAAMLRVEIAPDLDPTKDKCALEFVAPDYVVHMKLNSASTARLPERGDLVFINGNAVTRYADGNNDDAVNNIAQGWLSIRYDPDVPVD